MCNILWQPATDVVSGRREYATSNVIYPSAGIIAFEQ